MQLSNMTAAEIKGYVTADQYISWFDSMTVAITCHFRRIILLSVIGMFFGAQLRAQDQRLDVVKIRIDPKNTISRISRRFIGLGYETSAVAQSNFFSARNVTLVRLYRNLSPRGLIRIGGNVSDHTKYAAGGTAVARTEREVTIINNSNLSNLGEFARATGWKVMWGLNLGSGSRKEAVEEAAAVDAALGSNLHSFEIGNEVEALRRFAKSYDAYHAAYVDYKSAIRAALPHARFSGPDSIGNLSWIANFAFTEANDMSLLTEHYYRGGAKDPGSTLEKLLQRDDAWERRLGKLREISRQNRVPFRINEVNSFYGGGKPGVSDTFGSALWCLDYMFLLASYGCDGVNMETDINQLGFVSHYSPIVHDSAGHCEVRPEYYGMLAFAMAGEGDMVNLTLDNAGVNLSAYATRQNEGVVWVTVVNKDLARDASVEAAVPDGYSMADAYRLRAPTADGTDQVTLAGAEVSADGNWKSGPPETPLPKGGIVTLVVPRASAVLLRLGGVNK